MNKNIFKDYIDACELQKDIVENIRKLEEENIHQDVLSGSNIEYPYQSQHFHIGGVRQKGMIDYQYEVLKEQNEGVEAIKRQAENI